MRWLCLALLSLTTYTFPQGIGGKAGIGGKGGMGGSTPVAAASIGPVDSYMHMNTSSPGTVVTPTILGNGSATANAFGAWTVVPSPLTGFTLAAHESSCTLLASLRVQDTDYPTSTTTQSVSITDNSANHVAKISDSNDLYDRVVKTGCIKLGPTDTGGSAGLIDYDVLQTIGSDSAVLQLNNGNGNGGGTGYGAVLETNPGGVVTKSSLITLPVQATIWYSLYGDVKTGGAGLSIYDSSGTPIGSVTGSIDTDSHFTSNSIYNNESGSGTATTSRMENIIGSYKGKPPYPLGPISATRDPIYRTSDVESTISGASNATSTVAPAIKADAGKTLLVFFTTETAAATVSSITDTAGNTFASDPTCKVTLASTGHGEVWLASNVTGNAADIVTVNHGSGNWRDVVVMQLNTGVRDVCATGTSTGTNLTSGSFTPTSSTGTNYAFGYITAGVAMASGANHYIIYTSSTNSDAVMERPSAPNSSQTSQFITSNAAGKWMVVINVK